MSWSPETFHIAMPHGPYPVAGYTYAGLGLHSNAGAYSKRKRPKALTWILTHLGSGHAICQIKGSVSDVFPIAHENADAGDWTFDGLEGWKNQFPDCQEKTAAIMAAHKARVSRNGGGRAETSETVAREIAIARAAA